MKKAGVIIHIFALLHAFVAVGCRLAGVVDELLLTILTMTMTLLLCLIKGRSLEYTASSIIVVNIIGYLLGTAGAIFFGLFIDNQLIVHSLSTFITTESLGWGLIGFIEIVGKPASRPISSTYFKWVTLGMAIIFFFRLGMNFFFNGNQLSEVALMQAWHNIFSSPITLIILMCINILYLRAVSGYRKKLSRVMKLLILGVFMAVCTFFEATAIRATNISDLKELFNNGFLLMLIASGITQVTVFCLVYMLNEAITARSEMKRERDKANVAQYRYLKLKRQVNPHFLFNSLNVLDCLVCEEKTEQASTYIHKLAGIYRYMIKSEEDDLVPLRDELVFVGLYTDLMKVRFPEGFEVVIDVTEEDKARFILPCSLQLLIENATKHNAVNPDNPLIIKVKSTSDGNIAVINNIIPKVTKSPSTRLGQKYIAERYLALSGKKIIIDRSETDYQVILPLL